MIQGEQTAGTPQAVVLGGGTPNGFYARDCLAGLGIPVLPVNSVSQLKQLHPELLPDLIIVDGEDPASPALIRTLKAARPASMVPIIAVCRTDQQVRILRAEGADDCVTLAGGFTSLQAATEVLLEHQRVRRAVMQSVIEAEDQFHRRVRLLISRYLSPQLTDRVMAELDHPELDPGPRTAPAHAAVMFADMRGFTSMAERLGSLKTFEILNEYFSLLTDIALKNSGTIFNMSGDSLMIGYGVPVERQDRAAQAINTASEMLAGFRNLAEQWQEKHGIHIGLGIGINDGEVLTGDVGSAQFMSYTMIGDTVNVASRLSQRARAGEMLFSSAVKQSLEASGISVDAIVLPPLTLRGRSAPLEIYCVPLAERITADA